MENKWTQVELNLQDTFLSSYQSWCQKKIDYDGWACHLQNQMCHCDMYNATHLNNDINSSLKNNTFHNH